MNIFPAIPERFPDLAAHCAAFERYALIFYTGEADHDFYLSLKAEHSRNVYAHACAIAGMEPMFAEDMELHRALLLAALYHDFGRFMQFHQYRTFSDAQSVNHGLLSVREVRREGLLAEESPRVRRLVLAGVALHNRFALSLRLPADVRAVVGAVRDADKLDIMRIMAGQLTGEGEPDPVVALHAKRSSEISPAVLDAVMNRQLVAYGDLATTTDFKLLVCGWLYDLNYNFSRKSAVREGALCRILDSLPSTDTLQDFFTHYKKDLAAYGAL